MKSIYKYLILIIISCLTSVYIYTVTKQERNSKIINESERFINELININYNCSMKICTLASETAFISIDLNEMLFIKHYINSNIYITYNFKDDNGNIKIEKDIFLFEGFNNHNCNNDLCILGYEALLKVRKEAQGLLTSYAIDIERL